MIERQISVEEVRRVLEGGEVIENYPGDFPYPSRVVLGWSGTRPLHVVAAFNAEAKETIVITIYEPNMLEWKPGFRERKP